ncbi:MAG: ABC transporter ATP-binding protein [Xanthobacteraceae bacterium]|nr:ABC transporter ATP-binding protein [Xanthobacteraceae bacterium]
MKQAGIEIEKITVRYGNSVPVRALSLDVKPGEFVSLLGPSGCGKTTTLRSIAGFSDIAEGDIRIGGVSVRDVPANKRNIGMVYQDYALFPHMSVEKNIGFGLRMRNVSADEIRQRAFAAAEQLRLSGFLDRYPQQLSGGQQQRVALARALVVRPDVLLLDEPMAALDKQLRSDMQFELKDLQKSVGITTVFVTHDQEEALSLSDRIAVMHDGKILQIDKPDTLYQFPATRFVAEFVGTANLFKAKVSNVGGKSRIELDGLNVSIQLDRELKAGEVEVMLRPEQIEFGNEASVSLPVRVQSTVFVGVATRYQVTTASRQVVRVDVSGVQSVRPATGEQATISWRLSDMRIYRDGRLEP